MTFEDAMDGEQQPEEVRSSEGHSSRALRRTVAVWARDMVVSVVLAVLVILFLYQPVKVEGTSMMPGLIDQERISINKFSYRFATGNIERGDLVVFWYPGDPSKSYIKRVIGRPGDTVSVQLGEVLVNGKAIEEPYVIEEYRDRGYSMAPFRVDRDEYFVMGDHRNSSNDSRSWGSVPRKYIYGKAVFVYWPLDKVGLLR